MSASPSVFARRLAGVLVAACLLTGCSMTPSMPEPEAEAQLPDAFTRTEAPSDTLLPAAARDTARTSPTRWWTAFDDSTLTTLVDSALVGNLDLATARARLEELQARFQIARAPLFPSATLNGSASRQAQPANIGISSAFAGGGSGDGSGGESPGDGGSGGGASFGDRFAFTTYSASLALSYELDFWGRIRSQRKAALSEFFASAADLQNTRIAIVSQTVSTYFEYVTLRTQAELAAENVALLKDRLDLTEERYNRGVATSFELYSVRQQYEQARADQPPLEADRYDARTRLAVLTGRYAGEETALLADTAPDTVSLGPVPAGLPSDLLMQRPDVMAAAARLEATRQRIGVARAQMLPSLSLTAEGGVQSASLGELLDYEQRFTNFIASLAAPLFQGGALWAEVDASKARYRQQLATYEQTLLTAFQEVKSALAADHQQRRSYERVLDQVAAAEASAQTQRDRYERGIGTYLTLLDAEQNLVQARRRAATARQALVQARLALYRALGGPWTEAPESDDPRLLQ